MAGRFGGGQGPRPQFSPELHQLAGMVEAANANARRALQAVGQADPERRQILEEHKLIRQQLTDLSNVLASTGYGAGSGNPDIQRIENIPGTRRPYDYLVAIQINANDTSLRTGTITISQEGPFVAVARYATFLSRYTFRVTDAEGNFNDFLGRSNGRFRPIHSASDIMDAFLPADVSRAIAFPGTGAPSYSSPALHAPYRTMEFDARIELLEQGSSLPRSNISVPSPFWTTFINSPFQLGALDFFARNNVIELRVTPQHINNPNFGNLFGFGGGGVFPFSDAQFDHHEGISDPEDLAIQPGQADPVSRVPTGVLFIGLHGYRIYQPPGAVVNPSSV